MKKITIFQTKPSSA